ncbi:hypothetical protein O181_059433 [Austropuccinia psidii MF-1]|uniref:Uncharacterized protein n=1 Tax=Austropuccinia psidii MF-1 TaxID=1389203 RepID=A0A9Q3EIS6_9BASI|nr:hypothetical protein [Austropuccinia psidii MF-1]
MRWWPLIVSWAIQNSGPIVVRLAISGVFQRSKMKPEWLQGLPPVVSGWSLVLQRQFLRPCLDAHALNWPQHRPWCLFRFEVLRPIIASFTLQRKETRMSGRDHVTDKLRAHLQCWHL